MGRVAGWWRLAARVWTVTATAEMAGLNVLTYLTAYLDACGRNGGKPLAGPDLERFLPWHRTRRPARLGTATPARLTRARLCLQPRFVMKPDVVICGLAEGSVLSGNVPGTVGA
jgi:hypothetical protein